MKYGQHTKTET